MKKHTTIYLLLIVNLAFGQDTTNQKNTGNGELAFGVRTTGSLFTESNNSFGIGGGWQIRYRMSEHFSSEWFADWIGTDVDGLGRRLDAHIGVSAMIYPFKNVRQKNSFTPYLLGGFCGDYTKLSTNLYFDDHDQGYTSKTDDRWSFATQLGIGTHYNITERFDLSLSTQYVLHFGKDIHSEIDENSLGDDYMHIHEEKAHSLEGHLFVTLSANFVLVDLLKNK